MFRWDKLKLGLGLHGKRVDRVSRKLIDVVLRDDIRVVQQYICSVCSPGKYQIFHVFQEVELGDKVSIRRILTILRNRFELVFPMQALKME